MRAHAALRLQWPRYWTDVCVFPKKTVIKNTEEPIILLLLSIWRPFPLFYEVCFIWMHMKPTPQFKGEFNQKTNCFHFSVINSSICCRDYQGKNFLPATKPKRKWSVLLLGRKSPWGKSYFFARVSRRDAVEERYIQLLKLIIMMDERKAEGYKRSP